MDKEIRAYVCRMQYYSAIKVETSPFVTTWIDFEGIMLSKMSDNERQTPYNLTHMWNIKRRRKKKQPKTELTDSENRLVVTRGRGRWGR